MRAAGRRWLPLGILGAGALAAWAIAQGRANGDPPPPPAADARIEVVEVSRQDVAVVVRSQGTLEPAREIDLVAEVSGRIAWLAPELEPGGSFAADALLVELERDDAELALERAEAALLRRESELGLARARLQRRRSLAESQVASAAQIEEAEHAERSARAGLREARAAREEARRTLARTAIHAPFAGRVRAKHVDAGQFVSRGTPLARVYAVDFAEVRLPVPVAELASLALPLGSELADGPRVTLRAALGAGRQEWPARLVRAEGEIAPRSRMLHVVARVGDPFGREAGGARPALAPGLFVEAEIEGRPLRSVFVLPRTALRPPDMVMTLDGDGRLRARRVEVLRLERERVVVGAGLQPGERVAAKAAGAMEGMRVVAAGPPAVRAQNVPAFETAACTSAACPSMRLASP